MLPHISGPGVETVSLSLTFFSRPLVAQLLPSDLVCAFCLVLDGGGRCSLRNTRPLKGTSASFFNFAVTSLPFPDASHRSLAQTRLGTRSKDLGDPSTGKTHLGRIPLLPPLPSPSLLPHPCVPRALPEPRRGCASRGRPSAPRPVRRGPGDRSPGMMDDGRGAGARGGISPRALCGGGRRGAAGMSPGGRPGGGGSRGASAPKDGPVRGWRSPERAGATGPLETPLSMAT